MMNSILKTDYFIFILLPDFYFLNYYEIDNQHHCISFQSASDVCLQPNSNTCPGNDIVTSGNYNPFYQ